MLDNDDAPVRESAGETLWQADMSVVDMGNGAIGAHVPADFSNASGTAGLEAQWLWYYAPTRKLRLAFTTDLTVVEGMTLHLDETVLDFPQIGISSGFTWDDVDIDWSDGETVAARVVKPSASGVSNDATLSALSVAGGHALSRVRSRRGGVHGDGR